jgi:hypothetical protein
MGTTPVAINGLAEGIYDVTFQVVGDSVTMAVDLGANEHKKVHQSFAP